MGNPRETLEKSGLSYTGYKTENLPDNSVPRKSLRGHELSAQEKGCCLAAGWGPGTLRGTEVILLHLPVLVMGDAFRPGFTDSSGNHRNQNNSWSGSTQSPEVRCIVITIGEVGKRARRLRLAENSGDIYFNMASQGESKQADSKGDTHLCKKKHQKWSLGVWRKSPVWGQILLWGPSFGDQNPVT